MILEQIRDAPSTFIYFWTIHGREVWKEKMLETSAESVKEARKDNKNAGMSLSKYLNQTYVMFIWVVFLMVSENRDLLDSTILSKGVCFGWKWKDGLIIGRKTRKTKLGKVVNEEVKLCGNASQTWFNQPTK